MKYSDLLKQYVSVKVPLPKYQFDRIKNNNQLLSTYFHNRNRYIIYNRGNYTDFEFDVLKDYPKLFSITYLKWLSDERLLDLYNDSNNKNVFFEYITKYSSIFTNYIDYFILQLNQVENKDTFIEYYLKKENYDIDYYTFNLLLNTASNKDKIIHLVLNNKAFTDSIYDDYYFLKIFLKSLNISEKPFDIINMLGKDKVEKLFNMVHSDEQVEFLYKNAKNPEAIKKILIMNGLNWIPL